MRMMWASEWVTSLLVLWLDSTTTSLPPSTTNNNSKSSNGSSNYPLDFNICALSWHSPGPHLAQCDESTRTRSSVLCPMMDYFCTLHRTEMSNQHFALSFHHSRTYNEWISIASVDLNLNQCFAIILLKFRKWIYTRSSQENVVHCLEFVWLGKVHTLQTEWECERRANCQISSFSFSVSMLVSTATKSFCTNLSFSLVSTLFLYVSLHFIQLWHTSFSQCDIWRQHDSCSSYILPYFLRSTNFHFSLSPPHKIFWNFFYSLSVRLSSALYLL